MNEELGLLNKIFCEDCHDLMRRIPDHSVDLILTDPPYGITQCKWDTEFAAERFWSTWKRIIKPNAAIVITAIQPFTSKLIMSNLSMFKYTWIWEKENASNFFAAKYCPLNNTEDVVVFGNFGINNGSKNLGVYNPQGVKTVNLYSINMYFLHHDALKRVEEELEEAKKVLDKA